MQKGWGGAEQMQPLLLKSTQSSPAAQSRAQAAPAPVLKDTCKSHFEP